MAVNTQRHWTKFDDNKEGVPLYNGRKAQKQLRFLIVGCGLGGLAAAYTLGQAGHSVTVVESSSSIGEVDDTGEILGMSRLEGKFERDHGAPWYVVHRADLHGMLFTLASPYMKLRMNSKVVDLDVKDPHRPSVTLHTGEIISADLIIGADGINSVGRNFVTGKTDIPLDIPTGDVAYRVVLPTHTFTDDLELRSLVEEPRVRLWMGPGKHVVGYCIRNRKEYNMVLVKPGDGHSYSWTAKGDLDEMRSDFNEWDPCLQKLLSRAESPLETWIHASNRVVLLGDSCHPMLPYRAQGSAMAIEDAAVLGNLFSRISNSSQIPALLKAYEGLRHARGSATQSASALNRQIFHLPDGVEQQQQDAAMKIAMEAELSNHKAKDGHRLPISSGDNPNVWSDNKKNAEQFDYDPDAAVDEWWALNGSRINLLGGPSFTRSNL
ncbi:FAD/NAD-P-binding domain-containing protein [Lentinula aciculospora]|uniref:FAD/NAD-P-binding domain-containing protein n=1 Tax=Lentinula aciculospora TaxID=153920 RepID=A0A9W9AGM6_9AGAR|nr:FAD/NAD-P-binding domain-containing protein [Lentinula aciculospora]